MGKKSDTDTIDIDQYCDARVWLRLYGYDEIAARIDRIMDDWKQRGVLTRRNWWDVLAGGKDGKPKTVSGITFPVLKAAQRRQHKKVTRGAMSNAGERKQARRVGGRWPLKT